MTRGNPLRREDITRVLTFLAPSDSPTNFRRVPIMSRRLLLVFLTVLWLSTISVGLAHVWSYEKAPGVAAFPPVSWPKESSIPHPSSRDTLIMLAHPKCPCTRAGIEELSKLMTNCQGRLDAYVLFLKPANSSPDWNQTDLWRSAANIPGVRALVDEDGIEAARFGAATSGQVVLYDQSGKLLFRGGITESRGHIGDNAGRSAIESLVNQGSADLDRTSVFGCPLFDSNSECRKPSHATASN